MVMKTRVRFDDYDDDANRNDDNKFMVMVMIIKMVMKMRVRFDDYDDADDNDDNKDGDNKDDTL